MAREAERVDDGEALVVALRALAWSARSRIAGDEARRLLDRAARLARGRSLEGRLAEVLMDRAAVHMELGSSRAAQRDLGRAGRLLAGRVPPDLDFMVAVHHHNAGRLGAAAQTYRRLLARPDASVPVQVKAANNLAMIESQSGHHQQAVELFRRARADADQVGAAMAAYTAGGLAWALARSGRVPASLRAFGEAEALFARAALPLGILFVEYADAVADLRLLPEATLAATRAAEEFGAAGVPLMEAEARLRVARVALIAGRTRAAEDAGRAAAGSFRRQRRPGWTAQAVVVAVEACRLGGRAGPEDLREARRAAVTLERIGMRPEAVDAHLCAGRVALELDRLDWALAGFDRASALARRAPVTVRLRGRIAAAIAAQMSGDRPAMLRHCRAGLADLDAHRSRLASDELRARASAHGAELAQIGLDTSVRSGRPVRVLDWMERTRAAALVDVHDAEPGPAAAEDLARLHAVQAELDGEASSPDGTRSGLERTRTEIEARLRRASWERVPSAAARRTGSLQSLRDSLGHRTLVAYGVSGGRVVAVAVDSHRAWLTTTASAAEVSQEVERLCFALRSLAWGRSDRTTAVHVRGVTERIARLRARLVAPVGLPTDAELVVVPPGMLQRVPWGVLHDGPVALAPSARYWVSTRQRAVRRPAAGSGRGVLLTAGPGLRRAVEEVRSLGDLYADAVVLAPPASTVDAVADALDDVDTVHFACHGRVRADNPVFSGLRLSDGDLTVQELEMRALAPHRVVLAACDVGADVPVPGEETIGFVRALLARGTAGVLGSLQLAPDLETTSLMTAVHRELVQGHTLAVALHRARTSLDPTEPRDLVNLCGFTVFGAA